MARASPTLMSTRSRERPGSRGCLEPSVAPSTLFDAAVGMHPTEEVIAIVGEHNSSEAENEHNGATFAAPASQRPRMEINSVHQPGEERRRLFRIPRPICSPGTVCPDRTEDQHQRKHRKSKGDRPISDVVQHFRAREPGDSPAACNEVKNGGRERN